MDGKTWFYILIALMLWVSFGIGFITGYAVCQADELHERICYERLDKYYEERL